MNKNLSGLVITYNEERHIGKCIALLFQVCNEVIIIDSNSSDQTVKIAEDLGAKVISQKFLGDGPQRIFGLQFCTNDWIINVDADEYLDTDAIDFFRKGNFFTQPYDAYAFRRKNFIDKTWVKYAGFYPDYTIRFFNKQTASPSQAMVHQNIVAQNPRNEPVHLLHYAYTSLGQLIQKTNSYTDIQAKQMFEQGEKSSFLSAFGHGTFSFFKHFFIKKGFLGGVYGFTVASITAFNSYLKYVKLIEKWKNKDL